MKSYFNFTNLRILRVNFIVLLNALYPIGGNQSFK